jgi:hypothetical protein
VRFVDHSDLGARQHGNQVNASSGGYSIVAVRDGRAGGRIRKIPRAQMVQTLLLVLKQLDVSHFDIFDRLDNILADLDNPKLEGFSEVYYFLDRPDLVKVWQIQIGQGTPDGPITVPGTYFIKFEKYYEGGYQEAFINEFLAARPRKRVVPAVATGNIMLGYKGQMIKDPFTYIITPDCGTVFADLEYSQESLIPIEIWISSLKELTDSLRSLAEDGLKSSDHWSVINWGLTIHRIAIAEDGLRVFNFSEAVLTLTKGNKIEHHVPYLSHRQSNIPTEAQAVNNFFASIKYGIQRVTFPSSDAELLGKFKEAIDAAGQKPTFAAAWSALGRMDGKEDNTETA